MSDSRDAIGKTYFRMIAKPVVLAVLFFIIVISMYYLIVFTKGGPYVFLNPSMTAEQKLLERARVSSLESWLTNLLQGNFGWSVQTGTWVSKDLYWRLGYTLLLVGISIAASVITGIVLVPPFSFLRRRGFKPLTFAHSVNGYFFGLIPLVLLVLIFVFSYLLVNYGIRIFPLTGIIDAQLRMQLTGIDLCLQTMWHMTLPFITLILVALFRNVLVIGSSRTFFSSENRYKNFLIPLTTIDFSFAISAALVVEVIFRVEGLGMWFINSLNVTIADYNVSIASLTMLLAIAVCLALASIPLDIIKHKFGLEDKSESKSMVKSKINPCSPKREWKFLKRKTFWIGLTIVSAFMLLGVSAPWITANVDPEKRMAADAYAYPEWYTLYNPDIQNLPRAMDSVLNWTLDSESLPSFVQVEQQGDNFIIKYINGTAPVRIRLSALWPYPWAPPKSFNFNFKYAANPGSPATTEYSLELNLTTPVGNKTQSIWKNNFPIWDSFWWTKQLYNQQIRYDKLSKPPYSTIKPPWPFLRTPVNTTININPMYLFYRLGYNPIDVHEKMLPDLLGPPGDFNFTMYMTINPIKGKTNPTCEISLSKLEIHILGLVYGLLGTQVYGCDCWSRLIYGIGATLGIASLTAALAILIGFPFGFVAGYFQGWTDNIMMTFNDAILYIPILPFILLIVSFFGRYWLYISVIAIGFLSVLSAKAFRYKYLTRPRHQKSEGTSEENPAVDLVKGIVGNFCLVMFSVILLFSTVDFLGFGDPYLPSWGRELNLAFSVGTGFQDFIWWWIIPPIILIGLSALGFLLLGISLDDRSDHDEDVTA